MIDYDFGDLLRALLDAGVELVVVGELSAMLNGVPVGTFGVDVVHRRAPENVDRLMPVLEALEPVYRIQPERRLRPGRPALLSTGTSKPDHQIRSAGPARNHRRRFRL